LDLCAEQATSPTVHEFVKRGIGLVLRRVRTAFVSSAVIPIWWAIQLPAIETPVSGHDVSGTDSQTRRLAKQSITTIMPV
jgi:hypothetical protein